MENQRKRKCEDTKKVQEVAKKAKTFGFQSQSSPKQHIRTVHDPHTVMGGVYMPTELVVEIFKIVAGYSLLELLKLVLISRSWITLVKYTLPRLNSLSFHNLVHLYDDRLIRSLRQIEHLDLRGCTVPYETIAAMNMNYLTHLNMSHVTADMIAHIAHHAVQLQSLALLYAPLSDRDVTVLCRSAALQSLTRLLIAPLLGAGALRHLTALRDLHCSNVGTSRDLETCDLVTTLTRVTISTRPQCLTHLTALVQLTLHSNASTALDLTRYPHLRAIELSGHVPLVPVWPAHLQHVHLMQSNKITDQVLRTLLSCAELQSLALQLDGSTTSTPYTVLCAGLTALCVHRPPTALLSQIFQSCPGLVELECAHWSGQITGPWTRALTELRLHHVTNRALRSLLAHTHTTLRALALHSLSLTDTTRVELDRFRLSLTRVTCHQTVLPRAFEWLGRCTRLQQLELDALKHQAESAPLVSWPHVTSLVVKHVTVEPLTALLAAPRLRHLVLLDCALITDTHVTAMLTQAWLGHVSHLVLQPSLNTPALLTRLLRACTRLRHLACTRGATDDAFWATLQLRPHLTVQFCNLP